MKEVNGVAGQAAARGRFGRQELAEMGHAMHSEAGHYRPADAQPDGAPRAPQSA